MSNYFNTGGDPGLWHLYLSRHEHQNLPLNEVRKRYLLEQADFQQFMMMMNAQSSLAAPGGGRQASQESEGSGARQGGPGRPDDLVLTSVDDTNDLDNLYALIYVASGEDARTTQEYYEVWEGAETRTTTLSANYDLANSYVFAQNPANGQWDQYRYNDFIQGEYIAGTAYTDYEGNSVTSEGPVFGETDKTGTTPTGNWDGGSYTVGGVWNHANLTNAVVDNTNIHAKYFIRWCHASGSQGNYNLGGAQADTDAWYGVPFHTQSNSLLNETTEWFGLRSVHDEKIYWDEQGSSRSGDSSNTLYYGWHLKFRDRSTFGGGPATYDLFSGSLAHPLSPYLLNSASLGNDPMFGNSHFRHATHGSIHSAQTALVIPASRLNNNTYPEFHKIQVDYPGGKGVSTVIMNWCGARNGYGVYKSIPYQYDNMGGHRWIYWDGSGWVLHVGTYTASSSKSPYPSSDPTDPAGTYIAGGVTHTVYSGTT